MKIENATIASIPLAIQISRAIKAATGKDISESRISVATHDRAGAVESVEVTIDGKEVPSALRSAVKAAAEKLLG